MDGGDKHVWGGQRAGDTVLLVAVWKCGHKCGPEGGKLVWEGFCPIFPGCVGVGVHVLGRCMCMGLHVHVHVHGAACAWGCMWRSSTPSPIPCLPPCMLR